MIAGRRVETWEELFDDPGGAFMKKADGKWMVKTPNGHLGNIGNHDVEEHEDGTITVSPSILVSDHTGELYHGFLKRGEWS